MPFRYVDGKTPRGAPCLWLHISGTVSLADIEGLVAVVRPGGKYHRQRILSIIARGTEYASDARKAMLALTDDLGPQAAVVTSPLVRAAINLITRFSQHRGTFRMFDTEAEALAWLNDCEDMIGHHD